MLNSQNYYYNSNQQVSNLMGKFLLLFIFLIITVVSCCHQNRHVIQKEDQVFKEPALTRNDYLSGVKSDNFDTVDPVIGAVTPQEFEHSVINKSCNIIKKFEKFSKKKYKEPNGRYSIGYGFDKRKYGKSYSTKYDADRYLKKLVKDKNDFLKKVVKVKLTEGQNIALLSFLYNIGEDKFIKSKLLKNINSGNFNRASKEFKRWVHCKSNGHKKVLAGLIIRRNIEKTIFLS